MLEALKISNCPCSLFRDLEASYARIEEGDFLGITEAICLWPSLHSDLEEVMVRGTYRGVPMGQLLEDTNRTRAGSLQRRTNIQLDIEDIQEVRYHAHNTTYIPQMVYGRLEAVVRYLSEGLEAKVFDDKTKEDLSCLKIVLDAASLRTKIQTSSPANTSSLTWQQFFSAAERVDSNMKIEETELRQQYRDYCRVLGSLEGSFTSMQIFELIFDPKNNYFKGIKSVLDLIGQGIISMSVESIAETWISVLESHNTKTRGLQQTTLEDEMMIAVNGPEVARCDTIVEEAMELYWTKAKRKQERQGHFVRTWSKMKNYVVSAAVDRLSATAPRREFLM